MNRRIFLQLGGAAAGSSVLTRATANASPSATPTPGTAAASPSAEAAGAPGSSEAAAATRTTPVAPAARLPGGQVPVVTPNGHTLVWKVKGGVKVGHLVAEPVQHEFAPGMRAECWGYNGGTPGPTIEAVEGDRVRIYVTNRLPEPTTVHWHGIILPNGMDGVAGLTQKAIPPGETYKYEFVLRHAGTFMYHPHFDEMTQMALGMVGMFVVHPRVARGPRVDRDFVLMTHEWKLAVGAQRPDPLAMMDFNVLTFNSKSFPATEPLVVGVGERVRIRFGNLSAMDHHPIHLHGVSVRVTATDGGFVPESAQRPETSVLVPVGTTRVIEFVPTEPGDWPMHCHMTHHVMTQMGHDLPVMIGADAKTIDRHVAPLVPGYMTMGHDGMGSMAAMQMPAPANSLPMRPTPGPFGSIDMGGMFTIIKVRERPTAADATTWYKHPPGTVAQRASEDELRADGIEPALRSS